MHRQPDVAFARPLQGRCQHPGQHHRVVEGVVRPLLGHAPVRGQRLQPQIVDAEVQPPGQLDGAHDGVDG